MNDEVQDELEIITLFSFSIHVYFANKIFFN